MWISTKTTGSEGRSEESTETVVTCTIGNPQVLHDLGHLRVNLGLIEVQTTMQEHVVAYVLGILA
jgi:hypothetical protein